MKEIEKNALNMAKALKTNKLVSEVYHPALPHTKNHKIWKRDFKGSTGLLHYIEKFSNNLIEKFYKKLKIFKLGYSWGGFESLITFPPLDKRIYKDKLPGNLIRIYCGKKIVMIKLKILLMH